MTSDFRFVVWCGLFALKARKASKRDLAAAALGRDTSVIVTDQPDLLRIQAELGKYLAKLEHSYVLMHLL